MKKLQDNAGLFFILCVVVLSMVCIGGVWKVFADDVIGKSFQTIGLLAVASMIIIGAGRVMDARSQSADGSPSVPQVDPIFTSIRHQTVAVLVASVAILALLGVLAIWDVLGGEVIEKSMSSMGILVFSSIVVVLTCLERENHKLLHQKLGGGGAGSVLLILFFLWIGWWMLGMLFRGF